MYQRDSIITIIADSVGLYASYCISMLKRVFNVCAVLSICSGDAAWASACRRSLPEVIKARLLRLVELLWVVARSRDHFDDVGVGLARENERAMCCLEPTRIHGVNRMT